MAALESGDAAERAAAAHALRGWSAAANNLARHLDDTWNVALAAGHSLRDLAAAGRPQLEGRARNNDLAGMIARQMLWEESQP